PPAPTAGAKFAGGGVKAYSGPAFAPPKPTVFAPTKTAVYAPTNANVTVFNTAKANVYAPGPVNVFRASPGFFGAKGFVAPVPVANYHLTYGKAFGGGFFYPGLAHRHWTYQCYWPKYGCVCYWCPYTLGYYYWFAPAGCYYPVGYIAQAVPAFGPAPAAFAAAARPADIPPLPE
ncbi:MAG: hypothetical protein K2X82_06210, partial [Gemmataceae bacterium]|nr:hypothetical protein [Gemmataceae bacterium]